MQFFTQSLRGDKTRGAKARRVRLEVEALEERWVPYALSGSAWVHPELVTISFVPDGTVLGSGTNGTIYSNLQSTFNTKFGSTAKWQNEFLRAAQTWAMSTNLNFTVVSDNGADIGSGSYQQGDAGFGDIRIGGYNFGNSTLAMAYLPPQVNNFSIAGDMQFNTGQSWAVGSTYDIYTVAMHEFGHSLGLLESTSNSAAMYPYYTGIKYGLNSDDNAGSQAIYSAGQVRSPDAYDTIASNGTLANASVLTPIIDQTSLTAVANNLDLTTLSDADCYTFVAPTGSSSSMTVTVQSSGLSLLSPKMTVYAADQTTVLGSANGLGQYGTTLTVTVNGVSAGQQFYVKVEKADSTPFSTGRYALTLNLGSGAAPAITLPNTQTVNGTPLNSGGGQALSLVPDFQVNTNILFTQADSSVAVSANGNSVIVWDSNHTLGTEVYAQLYDSKGVAKGSEFQVNSYVSSPWFFSSQTKPKVAMDAYGDFVVVWESYGQDGSGYGVYARLFDPNGNPLGGEFRVNVTTAGNQYNPSVAWSANGNIVVAWQSDGQWGYGAGVYGRVFNVNGAALTGEFQLSSQSGNNQANPVVAVDVNGNFVAAWNGDGQDKDVFARRFNAQGAALGTEFTVNQYTTGDQDTPALGMDGFGNFVVAWESNGQDGSGKGVYARRYDLNGNALGNEFRVNNTTANDQAVPAVAMDPKGNFAVTWASYGQDGSGWGVYARLITAGGNFVGNEFGVNTITLLDQRHPSVGLNDDGRLVIAWEGAGLLDTYGIFARTYKVFSSNGVDPLSPDPFQGSDESPRPTAQNQGGGQHSSPGHAPAPSQQALALVAHFQNPIFGATNWNSFTTVPQGNSSVPGQPTVSGGTQGTKPKNDSHTGSGGGLSPAWTKAYSALFANEDWLADVMGSL